MTQTWSTTRSRVRPGDSQLAAQALVSGHEGLVRDKELDKHPLSVPASPLRFADCRSPALAHPSGEQVSSPV